jgi:hypothetical protein
MGLFSLGNGIELERELSYPITQAYKLGRELIEAFREDGLDVRFLLEEPPTKISARLRDEARGTDLRAEVQLVATSQGCKLRLALKGQIFVGGVAGFFASQSRVASEAKKRLTQLLDQSFDSARVPPDLSSPVPCSSEAGELDARQALKPAEVPESKVPELVVPESKVPEFKDPSEAEAPEPSPEIVPERREPSIIEAPTSAESPSPAGPRSVENRLKVLTTMHERGFISAEDYRDKRREILESL